MKPRLKNNAGQGVAEGKPLDTMTVAKSLAIAGGMIVTEVAVEVEVMEFN